MWLENNTADHTVTGSGLRDLRVLVTLPGSGVSDSAVMRKSTRSSSHTPCEGRGVLVVVVTPPSQASEHQGLAGRALWRLAWQSGPHGAAVCPPRSGVSLAL